ncbi:MAG: efflux transporter outer membrane subunit [Syntrophales bacterium]|nr:efflux transporter outer membrane subunit [Syntrophales bacterium]
MKIMGKAIILSLFMIIALSGCMMGPDYRKPTVETPGAWRFEEKEARQIGNTAWWEQFDDPVLNELIKVSLKENKDLKIASARVEEFMGRYGISRAALFPTVYAGASAGRSRVTELGPTALTSATQNPANNYTALLNASWEIDLWGKLRRATEAARADLLTQEEGRISVVLTLVASVASAYVNLGNLDRQLEIAKQTAQSRKESYDLFLIRFRGGVISELELNQVKSEYEQALATIPVLEKVISQQENALSILLGRNPGPVPRGKKIGELVLPPIPAGLPSGLLANRPDVRQAEQSLIAANARIGVAKSLYFPSISLTGAFGVSSTDLTNLFTGPARAWSWAVPLATPIFTSGAISGQIKAAEAQQEQALLRYQQTIQTAFREVEDALIDQKRSREALDIQNRQIESLKSYARFARLRFDNGYTSYIEVLDAERSLFNAELTRAQTKGTLFQALVNLYKAMGGGWIVEMDKKVNDDGKRTELYSGSKSKTKARRQGRGVAGVVRQAHHDIR